MKSVEIQIPSISKTIQFNIGQNAQDNFDIIDRSNSHDVWFHIHNFPSAHIIAMIPDEIDKKQMKYIIKQGAILSKQHSKIASQKKISIIYTPVHNIIKLQPVGTVGFIDQTKTKIIEL